MSGKERNFDRLPVDLVDTLGVQYDYESIMHYSRTAFSVNGQPTVLPKRDPFANLGQRDGFSHSDILKINKLYRCGQCLQPLALHTSALVAVVVVVVVVEMVVVVENGGGGSGDRKWWW